MFLRPASAAAAAAAEYKTFYIIHNGYGRCIASECRVSRVYYKKNARADKSVRSVERERADEE